MYIMTIHVMTQLSKGLILGKIIVILAITDIHTDIKEFDAE